jgi:NADH:ubiquinone oxidoreductase subunit F (NADH-binding)
VISRSRDANFDGVAVFDGRAFYFENSDNDQVPTKLFGRTPSVRNEGHKQTAFTLSVTFVLKTYKGGATTLAPARCPASRLP